MTATSPSEALAKVKKLAKADSSDYAANITKGTMNGAITGGVIGLMFGYYKKYNLYGCALTGIVLGGITANFLIKYNK